MSLYLILCRDIFVCRYTISIHLSILFILSVHRIRVCSWGLEKLLNCSLYQLFRTSFYYHLYFCAQIHSCCSSFGCICDIIIVAVTSSEVSNGHFAAIIYHEWIWSLHFIGTNLWNKRVSKRNGHSLPGKWTKSRDPVAIDDFCRKSMNQKLPNNDSSRIFVKLHQIIIIGQSSVIMRPK